MKMIDMTNQKFGRLLVVAIHGKDRDHRVTWLCKCDCGDTAVVPGKRLRNGHTQSCGCLQRERAGNYSRTHGQSGTLVYKIWKEMRSRCQNENSGSYHRYGGRGVSVAPEWESFEVFIRDMGPRPSTAFSIDRIDNNGNYEPSNCRWATQSQQARNKRTTVVTEAILEKAKVFDALGFGTAYIASALNVSRAALYKALASTGFDYGTH